MRVLDVHFDLCFASTTESQSIRILLILISITSSLLLFHNDPGFVYDGAQANKIIYSLVTPFLILKRTERGDLGVSVTESVFERLPQSTAKALISLWTLMQTFSSQLYPQL